VPSRRPITNPLPTSVSNYAWIAVQLDP